MRTWPYYSENEIAVADEVLRSGKVNYWTGDQGRKFEQEYASYCHVKYAVAVANGTVALELALRALGIGPGDEVIVPSRTFIASASSVVSCGARPIFADIEKNSQNISARTIQNALTLRTKAIIAVHLSGLPCDMDPISELAAKRDLKIIEDCAQAHGAVYKGRPVGSLGDVAAFSFCQDKIVSTVGEGGMLVTNNEKIWSKAWSYKDHGKSYDAVYKHNHPPGFRWLHHSFGTNWRMTEIQAAIGRLQLCKLPKWHEIRNHNAEYLNKRLKRVPSIRLIKTPGYVEHAYYKYDVFIRPEQLKKDWDRDRIMAAINARGVPCFTGSCSEIYLEKAFEIDGMQPAKRLPNAKELGQTGLTFWVHPLLDETDMNEISSAIENIMYDATKQSRSLIVFDKNSRTEFVRNLYHSHI